MHSHSGDRNVLFAMSLLKFDDTGAGHPLQGQRVAHAW
jgi:hypothetical protein